MIHQQATVLAINGKHVEIEVQRQSSCGDCSLSKSCGVGALGRLLGRRDKLVITNNELNLKRGDHILLGIPERGLLSASLLVYGLPLLMLFVAAMIAHSFTDSSELAVTVSAVVGFLGGLYLSSILVDKRHATQLNPQVLQVNNEPINRF
jgi:sigma-E factor negative regulatory protein RseC